MKILLGKDIRRADLHTMQREPVTGIDLMERAAVALEAGTVAAAETPAASDMAGLQLRESAYGKDGCAPEYLIVAGKGNNGGDGLAVARLLKRRFGDSREVSVLLLFPSERLSDDCRRNLERLPTGIRVYAFSEGRITADGAEVPPGRLFRKNTVIIDAILGTGVTGAVRGVAQQAIRLVNGHSRGCRMVISVDMPSGLPTEPWRRPEQEADISGENAARTSPPADIVSAGLTLTIEFPKLALMLPETGKYAGWLRTVHIGLDSEFIDDCDSPFTAVDREYAASLLEPRGEFDHKGTHGHALVIAGSAEYMGAAILCTGAALRSGCGLVTAHIPSEGRTAMLVSHPSAIVSADEAPVFSSLPADLGKYSSVAAGPGLGRSDTAAAALRELLASLHEHPGTTTLVLDADALNVISEHPDMLYTIPAGSVLTPHIGELKRLMRAAAVSGLLEDAGSAGADSPWHDDMHRIALVRQLASSLKSVIVVKGAHTMTCSPDGRCFFNMSGNPGMAKGGSGDVLTGLIAGLAARGYDPLAAAVLGVWFHGRAGDDAAASRGVESMNAADLLENIRI
ncbi:MAG TPA: NAD(P)H-hydrate dehydratase [Candidatus Cryptobacteroides merdipullorum]|uniref:Bifunctional NAD(P)H-hydrate repair enzyme n=1 Tax=Candidatus Cryptobacteroides merdipullorum TaxID=2840771 RepID=A0A9D1GPE9_9BACT|nr:NAD(P)H-hydrate dehydratase [Candidatus Cryptobacteroides merdipullorum]